VLHSCRGEEVLVIRILYSYHQALVTRATYHTHSSDHSREVLRVSDHSRGVLLTSTGNSYLIFLFIAMNVGF
jgi:hypothetical protein